MGGGGFPIVIRPMLPETLIVLDVLVLLLWLRILVWTALSCWWYAVQRRTARQISAVAPTAKTNVSIIVPAYNEERDIAATLGSLNSLAPPADEVIVVDDGSFDQTSLVACAYLTQHPRGRLIRLPTNRGKAHALNAAIAIATGDVIATIDADTVLSTDALGLALEELQRRGADAVTFHLDVTTHSSLISQLQSQEYALSFNFGRAGQSLLGAVAVLPGAATLFRKSAFPALPFSARTCTEDADLTLVLSGQNCKLALASMPRACTLVPTTIIDLMRQRIRWTMGHIQCSLLYLHPRGKSPRFIVFVLPNFILSTFASIMLWLLTAIFCLCGKSSWLGFGGAEVVGISLVITYAQRLIAYCAVGRAPMNFRLFILEPLVMGMVHSVSMICALAFSWSSIHRRAVSSDPDLSECSDKSGAYAPPSQ